MTDDEVVNLLRRFLRKDLGTLPIPNDETLLSMAHRTLGGVSTAPAMHKAWCDFVRLIRVFMVLRRPRGPHAG